jgi:hypothetical protein
MNRDLFTILNIGAGVLVLAAGFALGLRGDSQPATDAPQYAGDKLVLPARYREWVWLSSGFGMAYGPAAQGMSNQDPPFDNVFVRPASYRSFLETGKWPDQTVFVLEIRSSVSKGSINQRGHFQGEVQSIEVEVKDEKRFAGGWAFFGFDNGAKTARMIPATAGCYSCHAQHGAVDNTFVQFYPTLIEIAKQKGTFKQ